MCQQSDLQNLSSLELSFSDDSAGFENSDDMILLEGIKNLKAARAAFCLKSMRKRVIP
jgi:hypothetical protein